MLFYTTIPFLLLILYTLSSPVPDLQQIARAELSECPSRYPDDSLPTYPKEKDPPKYKTITLSDDEPPVYKTKGLPAYVTAISSDDDPPIYATTTILPISTAPYTYSIPTITSETFPPNSIATGGAGGQFTTFSPSVISSISSDPFPPNSIASGEAGGTFSTAPRPSLTTFTPGTEGVQGTAVPLQIGGFGIRKGRL